MTDRDPIRPRDSPASEATTGPSSPTIDVSVVLPCLNEARTLASCITAAESACLAAGLVSEVIVADNGSSDDSVAIAERLGARVVHIEARGYGSALLGGIAAARANLVVMGDADDSYDFSTIPEFVSRLRDGFDLVMGDRFAGGIEPHAMSWLHRHIGNPILSGIGRTFFRSRVRDFHCGLRGFRRDSINSLGLSSHGMEFASEMVIKASLHGLRIAELPVPLRRDGRDRAPHLNTWRDGWRHLRFMLLFSPRWLFLTPGVLSMSVGLGLTIWLIPGGRRLFGVGFDLQTLLVGGLLILVGYQLVVFALFTKIFVMREGLHPPHPVLNRLFRYIRLEAGIAVGLLMTAAGVLALIVATVHWADVGFGPLDVETSMRVTIPAVILSALGVETIFASFFLSILGVPPREIDRRQTPRVPDDGHES